MSNKNAIKDNNQYDSVDIVKFVFSILVIGIHTSPFSFNIWLDRGFGIVTRLCVPFFFTTSAFFLFKNGGYKKYIKRISCLYFIWSFVYLPFSIRGFIQQGLSSTVITLLWKGNDFALWYLWGTVVATLLVVMLYRLFRGNCTKVMVVSLIIFLIGLLSSTWNPLISKCFPVLANALQEVEVMVGSRSGLLYGTVYVSLGLLISQNNMLSKKASLIGFFISMLFLVMESIIFVLFFRTEKTVLWLSVIPATWFLVSFLLRVEIDVPMKLCKMLRSMSTVMYLSQYLFIIAWSNFLSGFQLFVTTTVSAIIFSVALMMLSKRLPILKCLY